MKWRATLGVRHVKPGGLALTFHWETHKYKSRQTRRQGRENEASGYGLQKRSQYQSSPRKRLESGKRLSEYLGGLPLCSKPEWAMTDLSRGIFSRENFLWNYWYVEAEESDRLTRVWASISNLSLAIADLCPPSAHVVFNRTLGTWTIRNWTNRYWRQPTWRNRRKRPHSSSYVLGTV